MKRRVLGLSALVVALAAGTAWLLLRPGTGSSSGPVTEAEARAHLNRLVAAAQRYDFDQLCSLAGSVGNCHDLLDEAGTDRVPPEPPRVVSATYHQKQTDDGTPGWVLVVDGTDARGLRYRTDVLIFRDDEGQVKATNAVYWSGARISFEDPNGTTSPDGS